MYFFPGLHVPGLTYLTYVIVILFVKIAQRVSGKARDASLGFQSQSSDTRRRERISGCVGVKNVSSDSSCQPQATPCQWSRKWSLVDINGRGAVRQKRTSVLHCFWDLRTLEFLNPLNICITNSSFTGKIVLHQTQSFSSTIGAICSTQLHHPHPPSLR